MAPVDTRKARSEFNWSMAGVAANVWILGMPPHRWGADLGILLLTILMAFRARHWFRVWVQLDKVK